MKLEMTVNEEMGKISYKVRNNEMDHTFEEATIWTTAADADAFADRVEEDICRRYRDLEVLNRIYR